MRKAEFLNYGVCLESFQAGHIQHTGKVAHPNATGTEASVLKTILDLTLCTSSSGYLSVTFVLFITNVSRCFSEVCESL